MNDERSTDDRPLDELPIFVRKVAAVDPSPEASPESSEPAASALVAPAPGVPSADLLRPGLPGAPPAASSGPSADRGSPANRGSLGVLAAAFILLAEGYGSLSAEVLALRMMVPQAGSSVVTTSILLAAYLTALGVGYVRGEAVARRTVAEGRCLRDRIASRLAGAALWTAFWMSDLGPSTAFDLLAAPPAPLLVGVALYSVGAGVTAYLLAQTICLVHYARHRLPVGAPEADILGRAGIAPVWALSTIGNVVGALMTSMVLLTWLGVSGAIGAIVVLLCGAAFAVRPGRSPAVPLTLAALLLMLTVVVDMEVYLDRTAYADYQLTTRGRDGERTTLLLNRTLASIDDDDGRGWGYVEWLERDFCRRGGGRILVIGAAGRSLGRGVDPERCNFDPVFVDIDPAQEPMAARVLHGPVPGPLVVDDGRRVLRRLSEPGGWDAVFVDAYQRALTVPEHLVTREFFDEARDVLALEGALYVNLLFHRNDANLLYESRFDRTLRSVFAACRTTDVVVHPESESDARQTDPQWFNVVYRCPRRLFDGDRTVYSDFRASSDIDRGWLFLEPGADADRPTPAVGGGGALDPFRSRPEDSTAVPESVPDPSLDSDVPSTDPELSRRFPWLDLSGRARPRQQ